MIPKLMMGSSFAKSYAVKYLVAKMFSLEVLANNIKFTYDHNTQKVIFYVLSHCLQAFLVHTTNSRVHFSQSPPTNPSPLPFPMKESTVRGNLGHQPLHYFITSKLKKSKYAVHF